MIDGPEKHTDIRIGTPIPSSVLVTLGNLIDAAWPGSQLATNEDPSRQEIIFRIAPGNHRQVSDEEAAAAVSEPADGDLEVLNLGPEGISTSTPEDVAAALLPILQTSFDDYPEAVNYLEFPLFDPATGSRYLLTFCRSAEQTPHQLRMEAEERLEQAHATVHRSDVAAIQALLQGRHDGNFEDGVKAALNALRQSAFGRTQTSDD